MARARQGCAMSVQKRIVCWVFFGLAVWVLGYQTLHLVQRKFAPIPALADPIASIGALDSYHSEIARDGRVLIKGWAWHPAGVAEARLFVDDRYVSLLEINAPRPDVRREFPTLPGALYAGFFAHVPLPTPVRERYVLRVDIKLHNGRTSTLGPWPLARSPRP